MTSFIYRGLIIVGGFCCVSFTFLIASNACSAEPEPVPQSVKALERLPESTLAFLQISDVQRSIESFGLTGMGMALGHPKIQPLMAELYAEVMNQSSFVRERLGISLDELLEIPKGELTVALLATAKEPCFCAMIEAGDDLPAIQIMLGRLESQWEKEGTRKSVTNINDQKVHSFSNPNNPALQFGYFIDETCFVASTDSGIVSELARVWRTPSSDYTSMARSDLFARTKSRCQGISKDQPDAFFFINPLSLAFHLLKSRPNVDNTFAYLNALGITGIQSMGGCMTLATEEFDSIFHGAAILEKPRRGVLKLARTKDGLIEPEPWVDENATGFIAINIDFPKLLDGAKEVLEMFLGPGALEQQLDSIGNGTLGFDLRKDLLEYLDGRITIASILERPITFQSTKNAYALDLKKPGEFTSEALPRIFQGLEARDARWKKTRHRETDIFFLPMGFPISEVAFCVFEKQLIVSNSSKILIGILDEPHAENQLSECLEYKLAMSRIRRDLGSRRPSMIYFQQPREQMKFFYELASSPTNHALLLGLGGVNPIYGSAGRMLSKHKLPPYPEIRNFFTPSTAVLVEDEDVVEFISVSLKVPE